MTNLPLVRLDVSQSHFFWISPGTRLLCARVFAKRYGECLILTHDLYAVAHVSRGGTLDRLTFPYYRYQMWQTVNKPEVPLCNCREFFDPEVGGPWKLRNSQRHHPMCIYDRASVPVYAQFERQLPVYPIEQDRDESEKKAIKEKTTELAREIAADTKQQRPDAWVRARDEIEGHAHIQSR